MAGTRLTPENIKSPFQLMAAWFAMLVLIVSVLLTAAANIEKPTWAAGYLVIFASVLILLVIGCVTLMLTKFRPHLQEGKEYARWLKDQNTYSAGYLAKKETKLVAVSQKDASRKQLSVFSEPNRSFQIGVVNAVGAVELVELLKNASFNAEVYRGPFGNQKLIESTKQQEAIWVGSRVDPRAAIQAIKIAVTQWPDLKYLHLSDDLRSDPPDSVHDQMFFGGSSSTVKRFGLSKWGTQELLELDDSMTLEEFHALIRKRYV